MPAILHPAIRKGKMRMARSLQGILPGVVTLFVLGCLVLPLHAQVAENNPSSSQDSRFGGTYRAPLLNNPKSLDPAYAEDMYSVTILQQLFDGLVQFSPDLLVLPALAQSWRVENEGRTYRFVLRKDARFHNGRRMVAADVVFSLSRLLRTSPPPAIRSHLLRIVGAKEYSDSTVDHVTGLEAMDERTVVVRLQEPYVPFLIALGMYQAKIVPQEEVTARGAEFGRRPVGTGPFKFASWEENHAVRLECFPDYYAGRAFLSEIAFRIYPGVQIEEVYKAFVNKELNEMPALPQVKDRLSEQRGIQLVHRPSLSLQFYGFNCEHPFLRHPDVRRALSLVIDRKKLVAQVHNNQRDPATGILPPGLLGYQPQGLESLQDTMRASECMKRYMSEGHGPAPPIEVVSNSQSALARAELNFVRDSWATLGVTMEPRFIPDWSQFEQYIKSDAVQIYRYVWYADMPDPDNFLLPLFGSRADANFMRYRDESIDGILNEARTTTDPIERAKRYQIVQKKIMDACPLAPLLYMSIDAAYQDSVQGIQVNALGTHTMSYHKVWLKDPGQSSSLKTHP